MEEIRFAGLAAVLLDFNPDIFMVSHFYEDLKKSLL